VRITIEVVLVEDSRSLSLLYTHWSPPHAPPLLKVNRRSYRCAAPNASMSTTPNGSGPELEKFPDAPPSIEVTAPEEVPHAGLRSLDHCTYSQRILRLCARILIETLSPNHSVTFQWDCSFNSGMCWGSLPDSGFSQLINLITMSILPCIH
jgi:hypothetical protein